MAFSVGQTIGDYRIVDEIGSGGMGTVYKVQHVISERIEAMKVILPSLIESPELAERFMREIKVQARLSHPNIASLHNALRMEQSLLMVMEYIEGTTLYSRLRETRFDVLQSIDIVLQVLGALGYAHAQGVVHRDIKPANIMITRDGVVKLMDFGIARATDHQDHLTRTGAAVGSLYYMSPEQVQGAPVDHRSDLYSLGITFYEMVTGQKPITGDTSWAIMNAHVSQTPRAPSAINSAINPSLSLAILKAIEKKPDDRYQSASEFAGILRTIRTRAVRTQNDPETVLMSSSPEPQHDNLPATPVSAPESLPPRAMPIPQATPPAADVKVATPTPPSGATAKPFEPADLDRIKKELAAHVGPMARILVERAARKASSVQQLYELLSLEVPEGQERKKFLAGRRR
ncbi:MAG TPA: protein kinase [Bryobacteraceae bacterium]|nr:protein kinase [Bryobacteraceae bacterium]